MTERKRNFTLAQKMTFEETILPTIITKDEGIRTRSRNPAPKVKPTVPVVVQKPARKLDMKLSSHSERRLEAIERIKAMKEAEKKTGTSEIETKNNTTISSSPSTPAASDDIAFNSHPDYSSAIQYNNTWTSFVTMFREEKPHRVRLQMRTIY